MPSCNTYHLTWVSLTLDEGYLLTAAPPDLECGVAPFGPPAPAQQLLLGGGVAPRSLQKLIGRLGTCGKAGREEALGISTGVLEGVSASIQGLWLCVLFCLLDFQKVGSGGELGE